MKYIFLFIAIIFLAPTCKEDVPTPCENGAPANIRDLTGLDGCSFVIELESGKRLEPLNLSDFNVEIVDSLEVTVSYEVITEMASICMVGPIVRITCLQLTSP